MTFLQSFLLGIVEGATEFLPVSSTGHLILASTLLGVVQSDFAKTFEIVIQLGAILAVVVLYWRSFFNLELLKKLVVAFIPTGIIGLAAYHFLQTYLLGNDWVVIVSLFLGGIVLIAFEKWHGKIEDAAPGTSITYRQAAAIGLFQAISIIPGVSRSGATIVGGMYLGIKRATIVEFSFLLAVPTMFAATGLSLFKTNFALSQNEWLVLGIGFLTAFVVALASIHWLLGYVRKHSFTGFGIYRIALSVAFAVYLFLQL
ncbi:MAG: undecaprenyl-diphosphatase UppP [Minisyncoccia bacterium]